MMPVYSQDYLKDGSIWNPDAPHSVEDPVDAPMSPSGAPMGESILKESIYYNSHIIPKNATFKVD